jgi:hypothetical protein
MNRRMFLNGSGMLVALGPAAASSFGSAQSPTAAKQAIHQDRVIAGGPKDFMEVRHVVLKGSNPEIGEALASIAKTRYGVQPSAGKDRLRTRAQRRYIQAHYPILFERMRGVAKCFDERLENDARNFAGLPYLEGGAGACSVVHYPPNMTADGRGVVSRNYEFSTGTIDGTKPPRGELPATARPYVIELHPDHGYASMALCSYDLLSGVLDGINSEGLTVTILSDYELNPAHPIDPAEDGGVGLDEVQMLRMLLDTCSNVEEAKETLLMTKQYYTFAPQHYLIADRHGKAFVWEYSLAHNREYIIENPEKPLISTNFSLHQHLEGKSPPSAQRAKKICTRYSSLAERIAAAGGELSIDFIKDTHKTADITFPGALFGLIAPVRTLWHAVYHPERRAVEVSFYLRDEPDPDRPGKTRVIRTEHIELVLGDAKIASR